MDLRSLGLYPGFSTESTNKINLQYLIPHLRVLRKALFL
jgi:hypothetical protein